jgi:alkylation response protein AidB-like acyl-CoA dehydrogenase
MDFSLTDEQVQLREAVRGYLERNNDFASRTATSRGDEGWNDTLWRGLAQDLGITGAWIAQSAGGSAGTAVDMMVILEELGASLLVEPFLETAVIAAHILRASRNRDAELREISAGTLRAALAWAEPGRRFARIPHETRAQSTENGWLLSGQKSVVVAAPIATHLLVTALADGQPALFLVDPASTGVSHQSFPTIDGRRAADICFTDVALSRDALLLTGAEAIEHMLDIATAMLGAEALGVLRQMLDDTIAFTKDRRQFGQPIASFQVLQHRMVDMYMHLELTTSAVYRAILSLSSVPAERKRAVSAMKVTLADACRFIGQSAIQLHGGMGMTDEVAVTHYFRRATVIESEFGSADFHRRRFADLARAV